MSLSRRPGALALLAAALLALAAAGPEAPNGAGAVAEDPWEAILDEPLPVDWPPSARTLPEFLRGVAVAARAAARTSALRIEMSAEADWDLARVFVSRAESGGADSGLRPAAIREALALLPRLGLEAVRGGAVLRIVPASAESLVRRDAESEALPFDRREAPRLRVDDLRDPEAAAGASGPAAEGAVRALGSALGGGSAGDALDRIREARGQGAPPEGVASALAVLARTCAGEGARRPAPSAAGLEKEIREALIEVVGSRVAPIRAAGLWACAAWHRSSGLAIPALLHGAADPDPAIRRTAFSALAVLPHRSIAAEAGAGGRILGFLGTEKEPGARAEALPAAGNFHDTYPEGLLASIGEALEGKDPLLRALSARALAAGPAMHGNARSVRLQNLATDPDPAVRSAALRGLLSFAGLGDERAIGVIAYRAASPDESRAERIRLLQAMRAWGLRNSMPNQFALAHFSAFSEKEDPALRPLWARLFLEMGDLVQRRMDPDRFRAFVARAPDPLVRREALRWAAARALTIPKNQAVAFAEAIEGAERPIALDGLALEAVALLRGREAAAAFRKRVEDRIPAPPPSAPSELEDAGALAALAGALRRCGVRTDPASPGSPLSRLAAIAEASKRMPADERALALECIRWDGRDPLPSPAPAIQAPAGLPAPDGEEAIRAALRAGGPAARAAMRRILEMPASAASPILAFARSSTDVGIRRRIADRTAALFAVLPDARRGPFLAETVLLLSDEDAAARRAAAAGLLRIAVEAEPGKDAFLGALVSAIRAVRDRIPMESPDVVRLFRELRDAPLAESIAVRGLSAADPDVRRAALDALEGVLEEGERHLFQGSRLSIEALAKVLLDERMTDLARTRAGAILARSRNPAGRSAAQTFSKGRKRIEQDIRQSIRDALERDEDEQSAEEAARQKRKGAISPPMP
ncbi:MAG: hypothetical protein AAB215_05805 [Planctomycetota bacterium]